jgi:hypothetical protein
MLSAIFRNVILALVAVVALYGAGWIAPTRLDPGVRAQVSPRAPVFVHPGAVLAEAAQRFVNTGATGESAVAEDFWDTSTDVTAVVMAKAPQPDISALFRRELSAVVAEKGVRSVMLRSPELGARFVSAGGAYRDGWRIEAITPESIVLRKRHEVRRVPVVGDYQEVSTTSETALPSAQTQAAEPRRVLTRQDARARKS